MVTKTAILIRIQDLFAMIERCKGYIQSLNDEYPTPDYNIRYAGIKEDIAFYTNQIHTLRWVLDWDFTTMEAFEAQVSNELSKALNK